MDILKIFSTCPSGSLHYAQFSASIYSALMNIYTIQLWVCVWQFLLPFSHVTFSNPLSVLAFLVGFLWALVMHTTPKLPARKPGVGD